MLGRCFDVHASAKSHPVDRAFAAELLHSVFCFCILPSSSVSVVSQQTAPIQMEVMSLSSLVSSASAVFQYLLARILVTLISIFDFITGEPQLQLAGGDKQLPQEHQVSMDASLNAYGVADLSLIHI